MPVWLTNCIVFISIDQTAKFFYKVYVTDVVIKVELQKRIEGGGGETGRCSPPVNKRTGVLRKELLSSVGSSKYLNQT